MEIEEVVQLGAGVAALATGGAVRGKVAFFLPAAKRVRRDAEVTSSLGDGEQGFSGRRVGWFCMVLHRFAGR